MQHYIGDLNRDPNLENCPFWFGFGFPIQILRTLWVRAFKPPGDSCFRECGPFP